MKKSMKNRKLFYGILTVVVLTVGGIILFKQMFIQSRMSSDIPDESKYCVNHLGKPQPQGACSYLEIEARKCNKIGDCIATCGHGCLNKNWFETKVMADCEAIPEYKCECINGFCQKK